MDVSTTAAFLHKPALFLGFLFRLFLRRIEMGLRARLEAMETQSTAQQRKRQRGLRAKSGLASLCSGDGTAAHPSEGCRAVLEDNFYKQKELLGRYALLPRLQRSARKSGTNQPRFLRDDVSLFDPPRIVHLGSDAVHSLSVEDNHNFELLHISDDIPCSPVSSSLHHTLPNSPKYTEDATLVDVLGSRQAKFSKQLSIAATFCDTQSALPKKSCPKDLSAATALIDMHVTTPKYHVATNRLVSSEPIPNVDMVASIPGKMTTRDFTAAAGCDMVVSKPGHCVLAVQAAHTSSISGGAMIAPYEHQADQEPPGAQQIVQRGSTFTNAVILKQEPFYKQLLERRQRDDTSFKELNLKIQAKEILWKNLRRTRNALFKLSRLEAVQIPMPAAFTPLSEEEELEVRHALNGTNRQEVLVQHQPSNIDLSRGVLQCLKPGAWLNDEVINLYMELLKERECREKDSYLKCHFFNTFFFNKLYKDASSYDYKAVRRWTTMKKLGYSLLECDKIFVPIHKDIHWCLAVINLREKKLQYLDSLKGQDLNALQALARYIRDEAKDKGAEMVDTSNWKLDFPKDIPEQSNGCDCGMFMIKYADFLSRGDDLKFTQENMEYFRKQTVLELLQLKTR